MRFHSGPRTISASTVAAVVFIPLLIAIQSPTSAQEIASPANRPAAGEEPEQTFAQSNKTSVAILREIVSSAFAETHDGWSSDEVILNSDLNAAFIDKCQSGIARLPTGSELSKTKPVDFNWTLLNMRKAGLLKINATKRKSGSVQSFAQVAEIAARLVQDRHQISLDRMMADPVLRTEFDEEVHTIDSSLDLYRVRKSAFQLRKQRRLRPELITRIADWGRKIESHSLVDVRNLPESIPEHPGIYIFRDETGYLYIGQSDDLRGRLKEHLDASSNFSLSKYLEDQTNDNITIEIHAFPPDSRAKKTMIRRAYESELIASRKPRFNIQP